MFTKYLEELKDKETEMSNILEEINSRITETEEWISDLEDRMVEITATEQNIEKRMKRNKDSLRDFWDNIKRTNIHIIGIQTFRFQSHGQDLKTIEFLGVLFV